MAEVKTAEQFLTETERRSLEINEFNKRLAPCGYYDDTNGDHVFDESGAWITLTGAVQHPAVRTVPDDPDND